MTSADASVVCYDFVKTAFSELEVDAYYSSLYDFTTVGGLGAHTVMITSMEKKILETEGVTDVTYVSLPHAILMVEVHYALETVSDDLQDRLQTCFSEFLAKRGVTDFKYESRDKVLRQKQH